MADAPSQLKGLPGLFVQLALTYLFLRIGSSLFLSHEWVRGFLWGWLWVFIFFGAAIAVTVSQFSTSRAAGRVGAAVLWLVWGLATTRLLWMQWGLEEVAKVDNVSVRLAERSASAGDVMRGEVLISCEYRCEITRIRFRPSPAAPDTVVFTGASLPGGWVGSAREHNRARERFIHRLPEGFIADSAELRIEYDEAQPGNLRGLQVASRVTPPIRPFAAATVRAPR